MAEVLKPEQPKYTSFDPGPDGMEPLLEENEAKLQEVWRILEEANRKSETAELAKGARIEAAKNEKIGAESEKNRQNLKKPRKNVKWTDIPKHPHLRYRSEDGKLILNYAGSIVETTWQQIEKTSGLAQKYWKQEIEKMLGHRQASNRKAAISLFLKLVAKGDIKVPAPNEEFEKNFQQFQAEEGAGANA
jgi:hypothetical protein